ncbi:protein TRANSPORT INHIBITOR RESPONSE 1-like [Pyrus x bretschneideri]|uniref:protein TRANSPORT INHIBITOR RESPONSE 1-like n=1 Tax=Pyrus x bretschneideri TaxID=225117 RepID=UPI00202DD859|nr:protein TRANSPORT INHIBITOR RESPONSE 1-like [Pyrus x bretschneideri]
MNNNNSTEQPPFRSHPAAKNGDKFPRVSSSPSLKALGSQTSMQEMMSALLQDRILQEYEAPCAFEGFSTDGLAAIAANCRNLRELDLHESDVEDLSGHWLSHFPDTYTSFVSLNISCLGSELSFSALERLVARCPNLRSLRLNRSVPLDRLANLLRLAPRLTDLGTGAYSAEWRPDVFTILSRAISGCKEIKSLSGFWDVVPSYLPAIYSICPGLTSLNLSYAIIQSPALVKLVSQCPNLQRLWVLDYIEDVGLDALAESCKDLRELRVFPSDPFVVEPNVSLTEQGLISVSEGCPKLHSVLYLCCLHNFVL